MDQLGFRRNNGVHAFMTTTIFRYDTLYRLTMASTTAASSTPFLETYAYNALGNVTGWKTNTSATSTYVYGATGYANPHAVTDLASTTYAYDNNGNVTSAGSKGYTWDYRNRLSAAGETGQATTTFGYDHQNNRVFKKVGTNATTTYVGKYYELQGATSTAYIFLQSGELIATVLATSTGTTTNYIHPDHLGSTNAVTDENADVVQTLDYYPYGAQRINSGQSLSERQYIGERYDSSSGLQYLNARYYEGSRGQFLSQDPVFLAIANREHVKQLSKQEQQTLLVDPQLMHSYSYGKNNPLINTDKQGNYSRLIEALEFISYIKSTIDFANSGIIASPINPKSQEQALDSLKLTGVLTITGYYAGASFPVLLIGETALFAIDTYCASHICRNFNYGSEYAPGKVAPAIISGKNIISGSSSTVVPSSSPVYISSGGSGSGFGQNEKNSIKVGSGNSNAGGANSNANSGYSAWPGLFNPFIPMLSVKTK